MDLRRRHDADPLRCFGRVVSWSAHRGVVRVIVLGRPIDLDVQRAIVANDRRPSPKPGEAVVIDVTRDFAHGRLVERSKR